MGEAKIQVEPHRPPNAPSRNEDFTNESQIGVEFQIVTADGGATIDTYSIEMDHDGNGFVEVSTAPLLTSPGIISNANVVSGAYLNFRYRAHNVHGWSDYSDSFVIVAATIPDPPTSPSTVLTFVESYMVFDWTEPVFTGGDGVAIDAYRIQVLQYDGITFSNVPAGCDPDSVTSVSTTSCHVEMALLRAEPFFLQQGDEVKYKIASHNLVGWSPYGSVTSVSDGIALMEDVPHKPLGSPTRDDVQTSDLLL
jgi:hypothetical protein